VTGFFSRLLSLIDVRARARPNPGKRKRHHRAPSVGRKPPAPYAGVARAVAKHWQSHGANAFDRRGTTAYHGTPSLDNAKDILKKGWAIGLGNAFGDGVYCATDLATAKSYAGGAGVVMKVVVRGRTATWTPQLQAKFAKWCAEQKCPADSSAKSVFLLAQGFRVLRSGNVLVVLMRAYRNHMASKIRTRCIDVVSIIKADGRELPARLLLGR
jgi:hypothetical protein